MPSEYLRTSDLASELGVHVNTIRLYEAQGYLPEIPRGDNGYRLYHLSHLEQARLTKMAVSWPYLAQYKELLIRLVRNSAVGDYDSAIELAYHYLGKVRLELTQAESAVAFLERWAAGRIQESRHDQMHIGETADYLGVTIDMLRNWERSGLITIPRDPNNGYRLYGTLEIGRLRVIRILVQSGYSVMAVLKMLRRFDQGEIDDLRDALDLSPAESANEAIEVIADRWLVSLKTLEIRAYAIITQLNHMLYP